MFALLSSKENILVKYTLGQVGDYPELEIPAISLIEPFILCGFLRDAPPLIYAKSDDLETLIRTGQLVRPVTSEGPEFVAIDTKVDRRDLVVVSFVGGARFLGTDRMIKAR